jgi:tetratricopeptide (TPR) repeat protein
MLNKALRIPEPDILFRFRLFIQDLYYQTENESISESTTVFLGQTIQRQDLNDLQINISNNDIIIFPQFLFGSTDQSRAIRIAKEIPALNEDVIPLLIQVEISEDMKCANLNSQRYSIDEDNNVLLNMSITGRLIKIEKDNFREDDIALIHVRLVKPDSERNIHEILEISRAEIKSFSPFVTMIKLMIKMNQHASAEKLIQTLFNDENFKTDANFQGSIAASCHLLAQSRRSQEDYKRALDLYLISLESFHRIISPNSVELSSLYSNIGSMYFRLENYEKAHEFFQKAIDTQLHSLTPDLYSVSTFTNSIGHIHSREGKYSEAIKLFERTLKILQQSTEPHDAEIAATHDDLGDANILLLKYDEALKNYCKSIEIQERIEPRNRQTLGTSYHTVGNIYLKLGRSKEALVNLKNALENLQQVLPLTHPTFALLYNNIGLMYYREEEYSEALKCYSKALEVAAVSLPENHSLVGTTLFNIGLVYSSQGKFEEAIESIEKSSEQFLKTLPADHSDIVDNKKFIESIKQKKVLKNILEDSTINF